MSRYKILSDLEKRVLIDNRVQTGVILLYDFWRLRDSNLVHDQQLVLL